MFAIIGAIAADHGLSIRKSSPNVRDVASQLRKIQPSSHHLHPVNCIYSARVFSGVHGKTGGSPVVLGSLLLPLTVIRQKLLYSVEQDENRHVLDRNTLIFSSPPLPSLLSATVTQLNNVLGCRSVGFENLYLLRKTELDLLLCVWFFFFAAVINFACGSTGGSAAYRASLGRLRAAPREDGRGCY